MQTATFDSQFGNTEGGVTSMSIKSGTNRFHGPGYYFAEPSSWARTTSSGRRGARRRSTATRTDPASRSAARSAFPTSQREGQDVLHVRLRAHHRQAAALRHRRHVVGADRGAAQRRLLGLLAVHHDLRPADPRPATATFTGQPFAGNVIPANRINPIAKKILDVLQPAEELRHQPAHGPGRQHHRRDPGRADEGLQHPHGRVDQKIS